MTVELYGMDLSPPVRSVLLVCKAIDLEVDFKLVNFAESEHLKPEFLKINPLHTVPAIVDGDYSLCDSHAIACYLASKYGKDEKWYPTDLQKRGIVDQRLHFDNAILFTRLRDLAKPVVMDGETSFPEAKLKRLEEAIQMLDTLIGDNDYVAGDTPTIADCCCVTNATSILGIASTITEPPRVAAWIKRCEENLPGYKEANQVGLDNLISAIQSKLQG